MPEEENTISEHTLKTETEEKTQQQIQKNLELENVLERQKNIEKLATDINELNFLAQELNLIVNEQREAIGIKKKLCIVG